ncbi:MAG: pyridoxamine 5'-phosphate oxidase family protein [Brooklawnia sp.]|nr:pyridoxamine 5'-phosphate oxidase family protein [Brooklawnia sp.]
MRLTRKPDRAVDHRAALDAFLDEQLSGVLATVHEGRPHVIPIVYARDGDRLLFHGSTVPGRNAEIVPVASRDAARTITLALPIVDGHWLMKTRQGPLARADEAPDDVWMGTVSLHVVAGDPLPSTGQDPALPVPASVRRFMAARTNPGSRDADRPGMV